MSWINVFFPKYEPFISFFKQWNTVSISFFIFTQQHFIYLHTELNYETIIMWRNDTYMTVYNSTINYVDFVRLIFNNVLHSKQFYWIQIKHINSIKAWPMWSWHRVICIRIRLYIYSNVLLIRLSNEPDRDEWNLRKITHRILVV